MAVFLYLLGVTNNFNVTICIYKLGGKAAG